MTKIDNIIPKDKEDIDFINNLKPKNIDEIKDIIPQLLEWTQDGNWPQAKLISDYFSPYINQIEDEIISILEGNDPTWKYWILSGLIYNLETKPSGRILSVINDLYKNSNSFDKEEDVDAIAQEVIEKFI